MWLLFREGQGFFTEILDFLFVVEGFKGREVDALENGFQGFFFVAFFLFFVDNESDALVKCFFSMVVGFEVHNSFV